MEKLSPDKKGIFGLIGGKFMAAALLMAAFLLLAISPTNGGKITGTDAIRIKDFLQIANVPVISKMSENQLKTLLNLAIKPDKPKDATYGLLFLVAMNELELIDMVLSQRYKKEAETYFNDIIDERIDLLSLWKGIGFDMKTVYFDNKIAGPMSSLALSTFEITSKTMDIFAAFHMLKSVKMYDGLWFYFDSRMSGADHDYAWDDAKLVMGWAFNEQVKTKSLFISGKNGGDNTNALELQFSSLWDKWGASATPYGLNPGVKEMVRRELQDTLVTVAEDYDFEEKPAVASAEAGKGTNFLLDNLKEDIENLIAAFQNLISKTPFLGAGTVAVDDDGAPTGEVGPPPEGEVRPQTSEVEPPTMPTQEIIDDLVEQVDVLEQEVADEVVEEVVEEAVEVEPQTETPVILTGGGGGGRVGTGPSQPAGPDPTEALENILISEVAIAWDEEGNEFIELYNANDFEFVITSDNLILHFLDPDNNATKITLGEFSVPVPAQGYFLIVAGQLEQNGQILQPDATTTAMLGSVGGVMIADGRDTVINETSWTDLQINRSIERNGDSFSLRVQPNPTNSLGESLLKDSPPAAAFTYSPSEVLLAQEISFDASSSTDDIAIDTFAWDFGDNSTSSVASATTSHSFLESGNFVVSLQVTDSNSATSTFATTTISVTEDIVINEVAWMGTWADSSDEWIELYNNGSSTVSFSGWSLQAEDGTPSINLASSTVAAGQYFLLERTASSTISNVTENQIYTGALANSGEKLQLFDSFSNLVDEVDASSGWFAGINKNLGTVDDPAWARQTMERINPVNSGNASSSWMTHNGFTTNGLDADSNVVQGTPKSQNSRYLFATSTLVNDGAQVLSPAVWESRGGPYLVKGKAYVKENAILSIENGTVLKFYPPELLSSPTYTAELNVSGVLKAEGTVQDQIVFTSLIDSSYGGNTIPEGYGTTVRPGDWKWIYFNSTSTDSVISNSLVRYGGYCDKYRAGDSSYNYYRAVHAEGTVISFKDSKMEQNCGGAIELKNSTSTIDNLELVENSHKIQGSSYSEIVIIRGGSNIFKNSTITSTSSRGIGIYVEEEAATLIENNTIEYTEEPIFVYEAAPTIRSNTLQNNYLNGIVLEGNIEQDLVLEESYSYIIDNFLKIRSEGSIDIKPGTVIKFGVKSSNYANKNTTFKVEGDIQAEGGSATSSLIVFTSLKDDEYGGDTNGSSTDPFPGDWKNIKLTGTGSVDNWLVRYGQKNSFKNEGTATVGTVTIEFEEE